MTPTRIFVPWDAAALSVGAQEVYEAVGAELARRGLDVPVVRTGSRGLFWLEPLVELETAEGRLGFGPLGARDVPALFDDTPHPQALGVVDDIPWLANQQRLTFARCGVVDPLDLADYEAHGGLVGLRRALETAPADIIEAVVASGLRGRGGAGFPCGVKWRTVAATDADRRYVVCNADEGDSGTFADRMLLEGDPFLLIEGMIIAGRAVGADQGLVYVRSEYPHACRKFARALAVARAAGLLGANVLGSDHRFDIELRVGAGAYICGEETSLLESLEGKRGQIRPKPPLPAVEGLFGRPTVVNNVLTLAAVPTILAEAAGFYAEYGMGRSRGTMPIQLAGNVKRGGLIERAFGLSLREIVEEFGGGTATGRPVRAVQVGGPLGAYWPDHLFDTPFDYEAFAERGGMIGHGGVVVFDDTVDMARQARFAFHFCSQESCGKCTPCRIGTVRGAETLDKVLADERVEANLALVEDLCELLRHGSLCALGGLTPVPVLSALEHFPADFRPARTDEREAVHGQAVA